MFSPDGKRIVSGGADQMVKVWDAEGRDLLTLSGHKALVWGVAYSPDGTRIVSGSFDKTVRLWDANTGRELRMLTGHVQTVTGVAFGPMANAS